MLNCFLLRKTVMEQRWFLLFRFLNLLDLAVVQKIVFSEPDKFAKINSNPLADNPNVFEQ